LVWRRRRPPRIPGGEKQKQLEMRKKALFVCIEMRGRKRNKWLYIEREATCIIGVDKSGG
jgi:hypothetical protein